jgi:hypothetical protein
MEGATMGTVVFMDDKQELISFIPRFFATSPGQVHP